MSSAYWRQGRDNGANLGCFQSNWAIWQPYLNRSESTLDPRISVAPKPLTFQGYKRRTLQTISAMGPRSPKFSLAYNPLDNIYLKTLVQKNLVCLVATTNLYVFYLFRKWGFATLSDPLYAWNGTDNLLRSCMRNLSHDTTLLQDSIVSKGWGSGWHLHMECARAFCWHFISRWRYNPNTIFSSTTRPLL